MVFSREESAQGASLNGGPLKVLDEANYPPMRRARWRMSGGFMRQSLGAMGQGIKFYVFDSGSVRAAKRASFP